MDGVQISPLFHHESITGASIPTESFAISASDRRVDGGNTQVAGNFWVSVSHAEARYATARGKYCLYHIDGCTSTGVSFASKKRCSDFDWIREELIRAFPGVLIPPIRRIQESIEHFEERFEENKRASLEDFLHGIFCRDSLAKSGIFTTWLRREEGADMATLKKEASLRPITDQLIEFRTMFEEDVRHFQAQARLRRCHPQQQLLVLIDRASTFRQHLEQHMAMLMRLHQRLGQLASLACSEVACAADVADLLFGHKEQEDQFLSDYGESDFLGSTSIIGESRRPDLTTAVRADEKLQRMSAPARGLDIVCLRIAREIQQCVAMREASESLDRLVKLKNETLGQVEKEGMHLDVVQASKRGYWIDAFVHRKNKSVQVSEIQNRIERLQVDLEALEQWIQLARYVHVGYDIPLFLRKRIASYGDAVHYFTKKRSDFLTTESQIWKNYLNHINPELPHDTANGEQSTVPSMHSTTPTPDEFTNGTPKERENQPSQEHVQSQGGIPTSTGKGDAGVRISNQWVASVMQPVSV
eukprot:GHVT01100563.1.p2 GENE.GHVT01100563.1~~GHVT01100563.1.p2  ORF type:complete len:530 (-),score=46.23 GHVT01100563.1:5352-6941(-)